MSEDTWSPELKALYMNNTIVHAALDYYRRGDCSMEQALEIAVRALAEQYEYLKAKHVAHMRVCCGSMVIR